MSLTEIALESLSASLGGKPVLSGINLAIKPGECVGLIGPNGAGKTTLLRAAVGLIPADGQSNLANLPPLDRARTAAFLPQTRDIAWPMSVERTVALGRLPHLRPGAVIGPEDRNAITAAIDNMDLLALKGRTATDLSGGEQARVLIARALAQETPFLLADEPAAGLDPGHQIALMKRFAALALHGRGLVISLHDLGLAHRYCSRLVLMAGGKIVADGGPQDVLTDANLTEVFGVRAYRAETVDGPVFQTIDLSPR